MSNPILLNNVTHQNLRVITERAPKYGDNVMYSVTFPFEFRNVQAHYPILFDRSGSGDVHPIALFGFQRGENLFLSEAGWSAAYIPALIAREPFMIGFQDSREGDGKTRMLSLDLDHPRVSEEVGERLFEPLGGRTPFLERTATLLETIYQGADHSKAFVAALEAHELLESVSFEIVLKDGSRNQLLGFFAINEERLQELSGDVLESFSRQGFLMPIFMVLASMANIQKLVDLKNETLDGGAG